jgi:hypothetical protein
MDKVDDKVDVDAFLTEQTNQPFLATVEQSGADKERVTITPWDPKLGCLCHASLSIKKSYIDYLKRTENEHFCCGKLLRVVEVFFKDPHTEILGDVLQQLVVARREHSHALTGPGNRCDACFNFWLDCMNGCSGNRKDCSNKCVAKMQRYNLGYCFTPTCHFTPPDPNDF